MQLTQQEMIVLRKTFLFHRLTPAAYMKLSEGRFTGAFRQDSPIHQRDAACARFRQSKIEVVK